MRMIVASSGNAASPAQTESTRWAPPGTKSSRSPRSFASQSGGRSAYPGGKATTTWRTSGCSMKARSARSSIGTPRMGRNCFGSPGPARTPAPAATMTTPTSGGEPTGELTDSLEPDHLEVSVAGRAARAGREEHAPETLARRLRESPLDAGDGTNLATQPDLAEEQCISRDWTVVDGGDKGGKDGKVRAGLDQAH